MKIYLAGPMRGIKDFNFHAFHEEAKRLRSGGHTVFNTAEWEEQVYGVGFNRSERGDFKDIPQFNFREALAKDLDWICREADTVAVLQGWEKSSGALAEMAVARALGLPIIYL